MTHGEKCICQCDDWVNAFGEKHQALHTGMRLTVSRRVYVAGTLFYEFTETPNGFAYLSEGFKPLRGLN